MEHNHPAAQRLDSGGNADSENFKRQYNIQPNFDLECIGCCYKYLTEDRGYEHVIGNFNQVKYGNAANWTDCFLTGRTERGTHGQFKTRHDLNLGQLSKRTLQECLTYQFYTAPNINPDVIAMGVPIKARLESIAVHKVKPDLVNGSKLNYHNAALLELYREKNCEESLHGTCEMRNEVEEIPELEAGLGNLNI